MANRILRDKFQKRWIPKVVSTFENDVLVHEFRVLLQVRTQTSDVARIEQVHSTAKCCIFNSLLVRQIQSIGETSVFQCVALASPSSEIRIRGQ